MIHLRDYQQQALAARAEAAAERPDENRQAIVMATGLGKTLTFGAEAAAEPGRSLILVHTDELASQAETKVQLMAPGRTVGVVKAERDETGADIIVGSVQTLARPGRRERIGRIDRLIVDECHHAAAYSYIETLRYFHGLPPTVSMDPKFNVAPSIPVTGYTATLERGDGQSLGGVWQDVAFTRGISWAVRKGFLVPPIGYRVQVPDFDYAGGMAAVDHALASSLAPEVVVDAWRERASDRSTVVFAPRVASAMAFAEAFLLAGVTVGVVHDGTPPAERRRTLADYNAGRIQVVCNAMILTEGWDSPRTKCVIIARPTRSRSLVIQMAGRGLRPWLDGPIPREDQDCLLLFVADSTTDLRTIADLSDRPGLQPQDGKTLLQLEDEFDLSAGLEPDPVHTYGGAVRVEQFDPLVARSSKVWTKTAGGALFVPAGRDRYVFLAPDAGGTLAVGEVNRSGGRRIHRGLPDVELAMALAEDAAVELGGDLGRLLADRTRPWRKGTPSEDVKALARSMGLGPDLDKIMAGRASGKAGKVSDLINKVKASRQIDPAVTRIKQRVGAS